MVYKFVRCHLILFPLSWRRFFFCKNLLTQVHQTKNSSRNFDSLFLNFFYSTAWRFNLYSSHFQLHFRLPSARIINLYNLFASSSHWFNFILFLPYFNLSHSLLILLYRSLSVYRTLAHFFHLSVIHLTISNSSDLNQTRRNKYKVNTHNNKSSQLSFI